MGDERGRIAPHADGAATLELGTLAPGMRADIVVLSRDPVADIRNTRSIERVYRGGVRVDR